MIGARRDESPATQLSTTFSIGFLLFFSMALFVSPVGFGPASSSTQSGETATCHSAIFALYHSIDQSTAIGNAMSSGDYQSATAGYGNATFESTYQIAKTEVPYPTCDEKVLSYNVVFNLYNSTGGWEGKLDIVENQNLTVTGHSFQTEYGSASLTSTKWSGYEVQTSSSNPGTIWVADSYFTEATPDYPSIGCSDNGACAMASWVGLTDGSKASSGHLVQAGDFAICVSSNCTPSYFAFYEYIPGLNGFTQCTGLTIRGGDTMYTQVYNEAQYGGSSSKYDVYVDDSTSGTSCSTTLTYTLMTPTYGEFILENPKYCTSGFPSCTCQTGTSAGNGCASLPDFHAGSNTYEAFNTASIEGGTTSGYINSFSDNPITMENQASTGTWGVCTGSYSTNAYPGSTSGNGDFVVNDGTTTNTPWYNTGC